MWCTRKCFCNIWQYKCNSELLLATYTQIKCIQRSTFTCQIICISFYPLLRFIQPCHTVQPGGWHHSQILNRVVSPFKTKSVNCTLKKNTAVDWFVSSHSAFSSFWNISCQHKLHNVTYFNHYQSCPLPVLVWALLCRGLHEADAKIKSGTHTGCIKNN